MKILISVISYNEEANIEATLRDLLDHNFGYDVVVIDNGSNDRSREICKRLGVHVIRHCVNTGSSVSTLLSYFTYAWVVSYDVLCQFDADGQHSATELPKIIAPLRRGEADCVIGSRFIEKAGYQSSAVRRIGIRLFSRLFTGITGRRVTDITSGFRAFGPQAIEFFGQTYRDPIYDSINQFLLVAHFAGLRIAEVPVTMRPREFGRSEFDVVKAIAFPIKGIMTIIACLLQRRRIRAMRNAGVISRAAAEPAPRPELKDKDREAPAQSKDHASYGHGTTQSFLLS
jgi:glycosyltransferase involved in cell wall biosynthesis